MTSLPPTRRQGLGCTEGMPELVDIDEDQDTVTVVPADQNADKDFFKDSERQSEVKQKYDSEIKQAPWTPSDCI